MSTANYVKMPDIARDEHRSSPRETYFKVSIERVEVAPTLYKKWGVIKTVNGEEYGYYDEPRVEKREHTIYTQEVKTLDLKAIISAVNRLPFVAIDPAWKGERDL
ncbi:hypothetical protein LCGC14_2857530 [marine sediment metagenome]|uniref:Uncharacterized protein n=1 Tax=marine sediment metagenome TaxID=412755 RepID=A0A0F9AF11_9ZZZZ